MENPAPKIFDYSDFAAQPENGRYLLLVLSEDRKSLGCVPLGLTGTEPFQDAVKAFESALILTRRALAQRDDYQETGEGIDGKPRSEEEKAMSAFLQKGREMGWENTKRIERTAEFKEVLRLRPPTATELMRKRRRG
jgi:hypothetical protein